MTLINNSPEQAEAQELNHAKERDGGDNYWLVALEQAVGDLPCEEPSAFDDLSEDQKEYLDDYYQLYDQLQENYRCLIESFGYKPRF